MKLTIQLVMPAAYGRLPLWEANDDEGQTWQFYANDNGKPETLENAARKAAEEIIARLQGK